jgi:hypothetical protein
VADEVAHEDVEDVFVEFCHEGQYTRGWFSTGHVGCGGVSGLRPDGPISQSVRRLPTCPTKRGCHGLLRQRPLPTRPTYLELRTNWLPSRSLKMAEVPQDSALGGATNSTPRDLNCS